MTEATPTYRHLDLIGWAEQLLSSAGTDADKAETVARILVEGDLLGHDTHGLALLGPYLQKLQQGRMKGSGQPDVVSDKPAALLWDGHMLPGPWLTEEAVTEACDRARRFGTATVVIRSSGHIACLAAYLERPARDGLIVEIYSSDPSVASVAPYGGKRAVFTPNPIAIGIPTSAEPILIDISTSITTNGMSARLERAGLRFPAPWLLDGDGKPTDDPATFHADPPGTIQLLGGLDAGHKGYGLTLSVEAMTGGLAAYGRADGVNDWGATVMVRASDPDAFGGLVGFNRQVDWIVDACRSSPAIDPERPVRLPGHAALARKAQAVADGLTLNPTVQTGIEKLAEARGIALPNPL